MGKELLLNFIWLPAVMYLRDWRLYYCEKQYKVVANSDLRCL